MVLLCVPILSPAFGDLFTMKSLSQATPNNRWASTQWCLPSNGDSIGQGTWKVYANDRGQHDGQNVSKTMIKTKSKTSHGALLDTAQDGVFQLHSTHYSGYFTAVYWLRDRGDVSSWSLWIFAAPLFLQMQCKKAREPRFQRDSDRSEKANSYVIFLRDEKICQKPGIPSRIFHWYPTWHNFGPTNPES